MNDSDIKRTHKAVGRSRGLFINRDVNCAADYCRAELSRHPYNVGAIIRLIRCLKVGAQIKVIDLFGTSFEGTALDQVNRLQLKIELCREAFRLAPHNPAIKERLSTLENQAANERLLALAKEGHSVQAQLQSELTEQVAPKTEFQSWIDSARPTNQFYPLISGKISYKK